MMEMIQRTNTYDHHHLSNTSQPLKRNITLPQNPQSP